jgi:thioredoxin reductase (NADPH)
MANADQPVILVVDHDPEALERTSAQLRRRFGCDYRIVCERSAQAALVALEELRAAGGRLAIVLADQRLPDIDGDEFFAAVRELHPTAKRCLLIRWGGWGERETAAAIHRAMEAGLIDYYVIKPWRQPDEPFNRTISEFLHEWARTDPSQEKEILVVGEKWSPRVREVREILSRNGMPPPGFLDSDSPEGREVLESVGGTGRLPVVIILREKVLFEPTNAELGDAVGCMVELDRAEYDLMIVGAGPAGLASAVYGASEGLRTLVVECESVGGQAGSSSLIRNYLGFSRGISGGYLATLAYQQAWVFGAHFLLMREATELRPSPVGWELRMADGSSACAPAVVLAGGVSYRRLAIPALEALEGGVFYGASTSDAHLMSGGRAFVVGGGNSAGQAATHLARYAEHVTLVVRGPTLSTSMSRYLQQVIASTPNMDVRFNTRVVDGSGGRRLERLVLETTEGERVEEPADGLFVMIGAAPRTEWLPDEIMRDDWGYVLTGPDLIGDGGPRERWPLARPPRPYETCAPGVFAVGDVRHRAIKRVASAVGEGSVVISQVHDHLAQAHTRPAPTAPTHAPARVGA